MARHHLIISDPGWASITSLVQLFTELGLDSEFSACTADEYGPFLKSFHAISRPELIHNFSR